MSNAHQTFTAGQSVKFEGRPGVIITAGPAKPLALSGEQVQTLVVKTYAGEHMIGSCHSGLVAA